MAYGDERRGGFGGGGGRGPPRGGGFGGPREMFDAKCSECGKDTKVPFKPTEGRPVYCQEHYEKHRPQRF